MSRHHQPGVIASLDVWLDVVERMDMGPLNHLTCTEVTTLAESMVAQRGEEKGLMVIVNHLVDSDEEEDELREHLADWPELAATLHALVAEDDPIIILLNDLEENHD